jgi:hypothetical protein
MPDEPNSMTTGLPPENYMTSQEAHVAGGGEYAPPEETLEAAAARLAKMDEEAARNAKAAEEPAKRAKAEEEPARRSNEKEEKRGR